MNDEDRWKKLDDFERGLIEMGKRRIRIDRMLMLIRKHVEEPVELKLLFGDLPTRDVHAMGEEE